MSSKNPWASFPPADAVCFQIRNQEVVEILFPVYVGRLTQTNIYNKKKKSTFGRQIIATWKKCYFKTIMAETLMRAS